MIAHFRRLDIEKNSLTYCDMTLFSGLPRELEEAAGMDGADNLTPYFRIALPLVAPGVATAVLLTFFNWNNFLFAPVLTSTPEGVTVPIGIAVFAKIIRSKMAT